MLVFTQRKEYKLFIGLFLVILGLTAILKSNSPALFQRFLGELNPLGVIFFSGLFGFLWLFLLLSKKKFTIYKKGNLKALYRYTGFVVLFASIAIFVDLKFPFSREMNIPFPESLLFYPVIAFFVEILFHVLPLSILLLLTTTIFKAADLNKVIWISMLLVATLEPTYQIYFMDDFPTWAMAVIWLNLFFFNIAQLYIFRRYDFISMYVFRIIYYLLWHIIWGYFRLDFLF